MRRAAVFALAVALTVSGCTGFSGTGTGQTSTVTPAAVPEETRALNLGPPVAVDDSLEDAVEAHQQALNGSAFAYRAVYRGPFPNRPGEPRNVTLEAFVGAERTAYFLQADYGSGVYRQWSDGSIFVSLRTGARERRSGVGEPALPGDSQAAQLADAYLFPVGGTTVTEVVRTDDGYRITASVDEWARKSLFSGARVPNASIRLLVGRDRIIRSYRLDYTVVYNGTRLTGVERYTYRSGPAVALPRPGWVDNVIANKSG